MAQLPHIAMLCHEDKNRLQSIVLDQLLPLVVKCLADNDNLVKKKMFLALLITSEQCRQVICTYGAVFWARFAITFAVTSPSHGVYSKVHFCY